MRKGKSYGDAKLIDGLAHDGLMDIYKQIAMGVCAEKTAKDFKLTRK